jgi:hypothetical protein
LKTKYKLAGVGMEKVMESVVLIWTAVSLFLFSSPSIAYVFLQIISTYPLHVSALRLPP